MQFRLKMSPSHSYEVVILCFMIHFLKNFEKDHGGLTVLFFLKSAKKAYLSITNGYMTTRYVY